MAKRINLPTLLKHLDLRNLEVYGALKQNEEDRKELDRLLAYLLPLWVSGSINPREQIQLTLSFNRHVNEFWWELDGHHELRAKLLAAIGLGHQVHHDYQARSRRKITALMELLMQLYPDIRADEVQIWCSKNSETALVELCSGLGVQEKDREAVLTEYRNIVT